ncbi:hypothetical protein A2462_08595 [candidate division WOR-1 bacterium RIFOXYC2_FULL_41_25]|uniref:UDP-3-O-[3-hydroxymyristoyl] glucosamine N-acyltransferase non-repeat region domain-containing protein n=1 Tax=candidate division WOR-1 bacterium RIFOXYC2_FULL_41_25 TaxID=1802586 RepID=A0A1F4TT93_UNCSA|nr:MAG: hypothetical protein A2462_08595 [candidate division WOR-1 bacterium RIFOXYC2_FULL_41_25]
MKLKELAKLVAGQVSGDPNLKIVNVSPVEEAKAGSLVFVLEKKLCPPLLNQKPPQLCFQPL